MKLLFELVFALIFPFVYVAYFFVAVGYQMIKAGVFHVVGQYRAAREEFEQVHGTDI